jgi:hypothetical protein
MIKIDLSTLTDISNMVVKQIKEELQLVHDENEVHNQI